MRVEWWFVSPNGALAPFDVIDSRDERRMLNRLRTVRRDESSLRLWQVYVFPNGRTLVTHNSIGVKGYRTFDVAVAALTLKGVVNEVVTNYDGYDTKRLADALQGNWRVR